MQLSTICGFVPTVGFGDGGMMTRGIAGACPGVASQHTPEGDSLCLAGFREASAEVSQKLCSLEECRTKRLNTA